MQDHPRHANGIAGMERGQSCLLRNNLGIRGLLPFSQPAGGSAPAGRQRNANRDQGGEETTPDFFDFFRCQFTHFHVPFEWRKPCARALAKTANHHSRQPGPSFPCRSSKRQLTLKFDPRINSRQAPLLKLQIRHHGNLINTCSWHFPPRKIDFISPSTGNQNG